MVTFEVSITGERLARDLAQYDEEFARALPVFAEEVGEDQMRDVADIVVDHLDAEPVVTFLRALADTIECAAEWTAKGGADA
jgi:hypothetical protein